MPQATVGGEAIHQFFQRAPRTNIFQKWPRAALVVTLFGFFGAATAQAAIEVSLFNHPDGSVSSGGFYGLRLDYPYKGQPTPRRKFPGE